MEKLEPSDVINAKIELIDVYIIFGIKNYDKRAVVL